MTRTTLPGFAILGGDHGLETTILDLVTRACIIMHVHIHSFGSTFDASIVLSLRELLKVGVWANNLN